MSDLVVLGMDPRFGGGGLAQMESFWNAAVELDRRPELFYTAHPTLAERPLGDTPLRAQGAAARFHRFDAGNQLAAARRPVPPARSLWVVASLAPYGAAAPRSGRPYACWLGTSLHDEWAGRTGGLPLSRRVALRINGPVLRRLERDVLRGASRVYATSPASRDSLAAAGARDPGILPLPVDTDVFTPTDPSPERPLLVFVGRADDPRKNAQLLLDALPILRRRVPDARVRLVGSPPTAVLPEGAEATGPVASVPEQLRDASLFVLPSRQEGFGLVAADGVVFEGWTPEELAETAAELLGDPARLAAMRASGREYVVREHSPGRLRSLLADAFRDLDG